MRGLSSELQLLVISYLAPLDIYHLEATCREFRDLTQDFAGAIWKECLLRQCLLNGVFWPSYNNLTEPAQFKLAATSALRFVKTYERGVASLPLSGQSTSVTIQADNEDILDFYLVQGGRFLITLEPGRIAMWDITQTPDRSSAILVWTHDNKYEVDVLQATRIIDATAILLLFTLRSPRNRPCYDDPDPSNPSGQYSMEYLILEVCPEDGGRGFEVRREKFLCLTAPDFEPTANSFTFFTATVLLHVVNPMAESIFIVWDYVSDSLASVRFDSDRTIHGTILRQNSLFNILSDGVEFFEIPPHRPVKDGSWEIRDGRASPGHLVSYAEPIGSCSYEGGAVRAGRWKEWAFTGPDILNPSHLDNHALVYELMEDVHGFRDRFTLHHFSVHFNPTHPKDSTVKLVGKCELGWGEEGFRWEREVKPAFSRVCDGRNAVLWIDDTDNGVGTPTQYLAIYPSVDYSSSMRNQASPKFAEVRVRLPNYLHSQDYLYETCPVSGTLAVLRNDTIAGEPFIRCYRFLEGGDADESGSTSET